MAKRIVSLSSAAIFLLVGLSLALALNLAAPISVRADPGVLYAKPGGLTSGGCGGWASACGLQYALSIAVSGDEIWVQAGVHLPGSNRDDTFTLVDGVALYGGFTGSETSRFTRDWAANPTILSGDIDQNDVNDDGNFVAETPADIQGQNSEHVVSAASAGFATVLDGFIITAGQSEGTAGGLSIRDSVARIRNCTFSGNSAQVYGGAISSADSNLVLSDVTLRGNQAEYGGAIHNYGSNPALNQVVFQDNSAGTFGGGMYNEGDSHPWLNGVTFSGNTSDNGGGGMLNAGGCHPTLINVTFNGNSAQNGPGGGMANANGNHPTLTNVTFSDNSAYNAGGGLFNANNSSPTLTDVTFSGNSVTFTGGGMANDHSSPSLTRVTFSGNTAYRGGGMVNVASSPALTGCTFTDNNATWGSGMYNVGSSQPVLSEVVFSNNGTVSGGIGGGMSNEDSNPTLTNVTFSGNNASEGGGMHNVQSHPLLTGVVFSENTSNTGAGMYNDASSPSLTDVTFSAHAGSGMINVNLSSPTLLRVTFTGNSAYTGGGMINHHSSPTLTHVIFSGNSAAHDAGGGLANFADSHPSLTNVLFFDNLAQYGGGMYNQTSSPVLSNITFHANTSEWGGGIYNQDSSPVLKNVILWGNTATDSGSQIHNTSAGSVPAISTSIIQGSGGSGGGWDVALGSDGGGNLDSDPLFVDPAGGDLRLQLASPAVEAGDNAALPAGVTSDLGGDPRRVDIPTVPDSGLGAPPVVDIGAYERQYVDAAIAIEFSPAVVVSGKFVVVTLTLTNNGSVPATQITVTNRLPFLKDMIFSSNLVVAATGQTPPFVWTVQDLAAGQSGSISVSGSVVSQLEAGLHTVSAEISADEELLPGDNSASTTFTVLNATYLPLLLSPAP